MIGRGVIEGQLDSSVCQYMLTVPSSAIPSPQVHIEASARMHGVSDDDMLHALRHHWRALETDEPSNADAALEVGVVTDDDGTAVIHAMRARPTFLEGWWTP